MLGHWSLTPMWWAEMMRECGVATAEGAGMDVVAEHRLDVLYPDGEMVQIDIRIGRPQPHPAGKGDWSCIVQAVGLRAWEGPSELFGEGSLHALMIAAGFLHRMLSVEVERGAVPHWKGGAEALDIDGLFVLPDRRSAEPVAAPDSGV